jgi:soluble epoxide hydrolase / lipid-phosphate phosphatase
MPSADILNNLSKQVLGYTTSGYVHLFTAPDGAGLVEAHDEAFDSLMYAKDPQVWKQHLGEDGGLRRFLESGEVLPVAEWMPPDALAMHNRILKGGYDGVFNYYKAVREFGPSDAEAALTNEEKKIGVPTMLVILEKDYVIMEGLQVHTTKAAAGDLLEMERLDTCHWAMLEDPKGVDNILTKWAAKHSGES